MEYFYTKHTSDPIERLCNLTERWPDGFMYFPNAVNGVLKCLEAMQTCDESHLPCDPITPEEIEGLRLLVMDKFQALLDELDSIYRELAELKRK